MFQKRLNFHFSFIFVSFLAGARHVPTPSDVDEQLGTPAIVRIKALAAKDSATWGGGRVGHVPQPKCWGDIVSFVPPKNLSTFDEGIEASCNSLRMFGAG